jgi:hypothetical protein
MQKRLAAVARTFVLVGIEILDSTKEPPEPRGGLEPARINKAGLQVQASLVAFNPYCASTSARALNV